MASPPKPAAWPYDDWKRITQFLESARLAFARERTLWDSLALRNPDEVQISAPLHTQKHIYRVALKDHLAAVHDHETLFASVLIHSYALVEAAAAVHLNATGSQAPQIETWGDRLVQAAGKTWADVKGGEGGLVEVAVLRNAFAHGGRTISQRAAKRLRRVGITSRPAGSAVELEYADLRAYRARLLSLLNCGGVGQ